MLDCYLHIFRFYRQFFLKEAIMEEKKFSLHNIVQLNCKASLKAPVFVHV